jgi:DNA-binding NarL/FixJ family response regulator
VISDQGDGKAALALFDSIREQTERNEPDRRMIYWSYRAQALLGLRRLDEAWSAVTKAIELTLAIPGSGMTAFLNAAEIAEARRDSTGIEELSERFEQHFAGRDTAPIRLARLEIAAIREVCQRRGSPAKFVEIAETYAALGARVRAAYRRATAARLLLSDGAHRVKAKRDLAARRAELVGYGALRYVNAIDAAVKGRARKRVLPAGPLSARQRRVALLMSRGLTDRRIARELRVSVPAASEAVRSVVKGLGVTTRSQVAAWVADR